MNLDEIFLMRESALEPMMQQNAIIEPLSILLKISLKLQPNQNPSLFRYWNSAKIIIDSVNQTVLSFASDMVTWRSLIVIILGSILSRSKN